jgi:hypothetical protein
MSSSSNMPRRDSLIRLQIEQPPMAISSRAAMVMLRMRRLPLNSRQVEHTNIALGGVGAMICNRKFSHESEAKRVGLES